jgi:hypothetical protein
MDPAIVKALREAARALAVGDGRTPDDGEAPATARELADLLDGLVVALGHLERAARPSRHVAPTPRAGSSLN